MPPRKKPKPWCATWRSEAACTCPQVNAFYVREFKMMYAAEEAARFLHHACRGLPARGDNG